MFCKTHGCFQDKTYPLLFWDGLLVTRDVFMFLHVISVVKSEHIFMARKRAFKSCLMTEFCFHRFVHFCCVWKVFSFYQQQCASNWEEFTVVRFIFQILRSTNGTIKNETRLKLLWDGLLVTLHNFVFLCITSVEKSVYLSKKV